MKNFRNCSLLLVLFFFVFQVQQSNSAVFVVTNTNNTGIGSLRWAMTQANTTLGYDTIQFAIPGTGVKTIRPLTALPTLTDPMGVHINGFTQSGSSTGSNPPSTATLTIEVNGSQAGNSHGFYIMSSFNIIEGLVVDSFAQDGIRIEGTPMPGTHSNLLFCNFVGTDPTGTLDYGNGWNMLGLWAGVDIIIGPCPTQYLNFNNIVDACLISCNYAEGVSITNCPPGDNYFNTVSFCYIGTDITGMLDRGNDHDGVLIGEGARDNLITDNVISGNDYEGVTIVGYVNASLQINTFQNTVTKNLIGLASDGLTALGNSRDGVSMGVYGPPGTFSHMGHAPNNSIILNTIAHNGRSGVMVWEHSIDNANCDGNKISQNSIYDNALLGIDLGDNHITMNDGNDGDMGANQELNWPDIQTAFECNGQVFIDGNVSNPAISSTTDVEIYIIKRDTSGHGEGISYVVSTTPNNSGYWSVWTTGITQWDTITAIAIDSLNNTSEFGPNTPVGSSLLLAEVILM